MTTRPRIVIDTNVWLSSILWPNPTLTSVLVRAREGFEILASRETLAELAATLEKPKFSARMSLRERQLSVEAITKQMNVIEVTEVVTDCRHAPDNKFLELAASGCAHIIVTGDSDLLALHPWRGVSIITPRQLLEATETL